MWKKLSHRLHLTHTANQSWSIVPPFCSYLICCKLGNAYDNIGQIVEVSAKLVKIIFFHILTIIFSHASVSSTYPGTSVRLSVVRKWFFPISIQSASLQRWKAMDLRFNLAPSYLDLKHPRSRQNFRTHPDRFLNSSWQCFISSYERIVKPCNQHKLKTVLVKNLTSAQ